MDDVYIAVGSTRRRLSVQPCTYSGHVTLGLGAQAGLGQHQLLARAMQAFLNFMQGLLDFVTLLVDNRTDYSTPNSLA
jgi:hypothetical protein